MADGNRESHEKIHVDLYSQSYESLFDPLHDFGEIVDMMLTSLIICSLNVGRNRLSEVS